MSSYLCHYPKIVLLNFKKYHVINFMALPALHSFT